MTHIYLLDHQTASRLFLCYIKICALTKSRLSKQKVTLNIKVKGQINRPNVPILPNMTSTGHKKFCDVTNIMNNGTECDYNLPGQKSRSHCKSLA